MKKTSNREKILEEGLRVVHERSFSGASVRDIVQAAGVPQGSFSNHFDSKEAFGLEILERYFVNGSVTIDATLRNDALPPLQRLGAYVDALIAKMAQEHMRRGCLYGNFAAEASTQSEPIRLRVVQILAEVRDAVAYCLRAAVQAGELPAGFDCEETAGFVVSSLQGSILLGKAERSPEPIERFKRVLFSKVLA